MTVTRNCARALLIEHANAMRDELMDYARRFERNPIAQHRIAEVAGECLWAFAYYAQEEAEEDLQANQN